MNAHVETRPELLIRRSLDAPRELVFKCWTEPERLSRWCCPKGFTLPHSEGEIRTGGSFRTCMRGPDGTEYWLSGTYKEIVPPRRLVFSHRWLNDEGHPEHETVVTVTLDDEDGGAPCSPCIKASSSPRPRATAIAAAGKKRSTISRSILPE